MQGSCIEPIHEALLRRSPIQVLTQQMLFNFIHIDHLSILPLSYWYSIGIISYLGIDFFKVSIGIISFLGLSTDV